MSPINLRKGFKCNYNADGTTLPTLPQSIVSANVVNVSGLTINVHLISIIIIVGSAM